jgi:hypothetical protein
MKKISEGLNPGDAGVFFCYSEAVNNELAGFNHIHYRVA